MKNFIILFCLTFSHLAVARSIADIQKSKTLEILTRNAPTTFYLDKDGKPAGLDFELGTLIARELGVLPKFILKDSISDIIASLSTGYGDLALAGLSETKEREKLFIFSDPYQKIQEQLICDKKFVIKDLSKLSELKTTVVKDSSYEQTLKELNIKFKATKEFNTEELLGKVFNKEIDCTVADSNIVSIILRSYPELKIQKSFKEEGIVGVLRKSNTDIVTVINKVIKDNQKNGILPKLIDKYYGHINDFDYYDLKVFKKRINQRLKKYRKYFEKAGAKYGLDWRLLAAISYQESHWNRLAKSYTGVRGLMMLTNDTAKEMKVRNRLNAAESIYGGAAYLTKLIDRVPAYIHSTDRLWMAVASYNVGYYHMRDARSIAVWKDKNPNFWKDVREVLPLLSDKKYYRKVPYGYARGVEPVLYVKRIRHYYDILKSEFP
ncbi:membrane-bound lytic murein transglycosylase MltF [Bacteriovorax sp. Seq25_V]|uniref:membrane-bound lytic murein transglycosylase MltF n=1 Tax=Bacteriovorax sp. Seq25_V TaxID=1201288 RepID=UPI000389EF9D|nr:membrane-bound lytic murein transglycosylase MltF [Bacteriovorax sp. Seq25_V]EQC44213.1 transglycosylase SLT domain protein [Bacteriovorax sp. Seq25_V]